MCAQASKNYCTPWHICNPECNAHAMAVHGTVLVHTWAGSLAMQAKKIQHGLTHAIWNTCLKHFGAENGFKHYLLNHMDMKLATENAVKHLVLNHIDMNMKQTRWLQKLQAIIFSSKLEIGGFCITTSIEWMDQELGGLQGLLVHHSLEASSGSAATWYHVASWGHPRPWR